MKRFVALLLLVLFMAVGFAGATVSVETVKNSYSGSGTAGPFAYTFKIWTNSDLMAIKTDSIGVETVLVQNTDYTVYGAGTATGGTVVLTSVLPAGYTLTLMRVHPYLQSQNYTSLQAITATSLNNSLDKLDHQIQQLKERTDRVFSLPRSTSVNGPLYLAPSASKLIGWDSSATALQNYPTTTLSIPVIDHIGNHADSLETAISDIGVANQFVLINKAITLSTGGTVPANFGMWVQKGGLINLNGQSLDIVGPLMTGDHQIFAGTGTVSFSRTDVGKQEINPLWWYDGTNMPDAMDAAVGSAKSNGLVGMHNATIALDAPISVDINNFMTIDFTGSLFTSATEMTAIDLNDGATYDHLNRNYKSHIKGLQVDFDSATQTTSIGLKWYSFSRGYIEEGRIYDAYIGMSLLPQDFLHLRGTRLQWNVIGVHVPSYLLTDTHPIGCVFEDVVFTHKANFTEHGLLWEGPYTNLQIIGGSFGGDLTTSDIHIKNTVGGEDTYRSLVISGTHFEQGLPGVKRVYLEDVSGAGHPFVNISVRDVRMAVPGRYSEGFHIERGRHIMFDNISFTSAGALSVTDATTTAASTTVTTATADTFLVSGTVSAQDIGSETTKFVCATLPSATKAYTSYLLTWTGGTLSGTSSYIKSHSGTTFELYTTMASTIDVGDTFNIYIIAPGCYVWGSGIVPGTYVASVDSDVQVTLSAAATLSRAAKTVIFNVSTPIYLDANTLDAHIRASQTTGAEYKVIYACDRSEVTFYPERRILSGVPLTGYSDANVSDGTATLDMQTLLGAQYPVDAHPKGYVLHVRAKDSGSDTAAAGESRVIIAKNSTEAGAVGKYRSLELEGTPASMYRSATVEVPADSSGNIYVDIAEKTAMKLTISVIEVLM